MKWLGIENEIERKARDKAREEERAEGISILISRLVKHGVKEDEIITDISESYGISREEAEKKVRECCLQPQ